ncbi:OmpA family protein [Pseudomonas sp. CAU 1711]|uniref:OmpA family protein n=1 Tax=Pseudomonas sp. CAU 1711 TaxID=3140356 RepID=UPI0032610285
MNSIRNAQYLLGAATMSALLVGCASTPGMAPGAAEARDNLSRLQRDAQLASRAPLAIKEAEAAVVAAEQPDENEIVGQHLVLMADRKVEIARALAQARLYEDQRQQLSEQREQARLDSRTLEADQLQRQLALLNARETERGLQITLGDLLFASGRSALRGGSADNLDRLASFLQQNPERDLLIEGHTDNVGSDQANQDLSQQRAETVRSYLQGRGVAANRLTASGKGEHAPVASNDSESGRQMNRRVEVIISHRYNTQR